MGKPKVDVITAIATVIVAITGVVALLYAKSQLAEAHGQAQAENLQKQLERFDGTEMIHIRQKFACSRLDRNQNLKQSDPDDASAELYDILNFFEFIGLLTKKEALDKEDVWSSFGYWIDYYYLDSRELIAQLQKQQPYWFTDFTGLAESSANISQEKNLGQPIALSKEDLADFYRDECSSSSGAIATVKHQKRHH
jgi:hypothetical protein